MASLVLAVLGCQPEKDEPPPGPPPPCPPYALVLARLQSGTVTVRVNGGPPRTMTVVADGARVAENEAFSGCAVGLTMSANKETVEQRRRTKRPRSISGSLRCKLPEMSLSAQFSVEDPRWPDPPGTILSPDERGGHLSGFQDQPEICSWSRKQTAVLTTTRSVGGPLPYPAVVTPDYVREFDVHLESAGGFERTQGLCPPATLTADFHFAQTAADVEDRPHEECGYI